ncbi:sensor histidine kinase [Candidatus Zixiibacteriota bacterium]
MKSDDPDQSIRPTAATGERAAGGSSDTLLFQTLLATLKRQAAAAAICLWYREDEGMRLIASVPADLPIGVLLPLPGGVIGRAAEEGVIRFVRTPSVDLDIHPISLLEDRLRSAGVAVIPIGEGDPPLAASLSLHLPTIPTDPSSSLFEWARWARLLDLMLPAITPAASLPPWAEGERLHHLADLHLVAGGLAHRVNERLSAVLPALERAMRLLDDAEPSLRFLRYVEEGLNRTSGLLARLLTFSGDAPLVAESVSMGDCAAEALRRLEPERSHGVRLTASIPTHLPLFIADRVQVIAALMEVIRNSLEAAPEGTEVTIAVEPEDDGISVSVTDEGVGMTGEILRQAILPFFSTKRQGEHPGLGLSMAEGCVRRHGGSLTLSSHQGSGTKVRLWFPLQIQVP